MREFSFQIGSYVELTVSGEFGEVIGRAQYQNAPNCYLVYYKAADGRAVEVWWNEDRLTEVPIEVE